MTSPPLISCILPTRARPGFVVEAIHGFLEQDYPRRELVVVDDGDESVLDLLPADERIRYVRLPGVQSIGAKRNVACENARGEFIAHVDDDDWYPPTRLTTQARALETEGATVCGTSRLYFFDPLRDRAWLYAYPRGGWVAGSSLMYRRSHWQTHRFRPIQVGEDWTFVRSTSDPRALIDIGDAGLCVATIHGRNASPKSPDAYWSEVDCEPVRRYLGSRAPAYRAAAAGEHPVRPNRV